MGRALASAWARGGQRVFLASRTPPKAEAAADRIRERTGGTVSGASIVEAIGQCPIVVLAIPWGGARAIVEHAGRLADKVVVDCTNPASAGGHAGTAGGSPSSVELGSCAEQIARWAVGSRVVKAFNTVAAQVIEAPLEVFGPERVTVPYCGDDHEAKACARELIRAAGFEPYDAGGLVRARDLESLAAAVQQLDRAAGRDTLVGLRLLRGRRPPT